VGSPKPLDNLKLIYVQDDFYVVDTTNTRDIFASAIFTYVSQTSGYVSNWLNPSESLSPLSNKSVSAEPTIHEPVLPLGPAEDPVDSLQLECHFFTRLAEAYIDNAVETDMTAFAADIWMLSTNMKSYRKDDTRYMLSEIMGELIHSWRKIQEQMSGAIHLDPTKDNVATAKAESKEPSIIVSGANDNISSILARVETGDLTARAALGLGRQMVRSAVLKAVGASGEALHANDSTSVSFGDLSLVDGHDVADVVKALFEKPYSTTEETLKPHVSRKAPNVVALLSLCRDPATIPVHSLLWRLSVRLLDLISPVSSLRFQAELMGFVKAVWREILRELRRHVELGTIIPGVKLEGQDQEAINLKRTLLNQKLCMLNYCITRRQKRVSEFGALPMPNNVPLPETTSTKPTHPTLSLSPTTLPSRGNPPMSPQAASNSTSPHRSNRPQQSIASLSSRFFATLTDIATDVVSGNDSHHNKRPLHPSHPSYSSGSALHPGQGGSNMLTKIFDALTSDEPGVSQPQQAFSKPPDLPISKDSSSRQHPSSTAAMPVGSGRHQKHAQQSPQQNQLYGTSWSSDRSWEDFSSTSQSYKTESYMHKPFERKTTELAAVERFVDEDDDDDDLEVDAHTANEGDLFFDSIEDIDGDSMVEIDGKPKGGPSHSSRRGIRHPGRTEDPYDNTFKNRRVRAMGPLQRNDSNRSSTIQNSVNSDSFKPSHDHETPKSNAGTSLESQRSTFSNMSDSFVQLENSTAANTVSPPIPDMGASILLEDIERVITESGGTASTALAREEEWASMEVQNENAAEGAIRPFIVPTSSSATGSDEGRALKLLKTGQPMMVPEVQEPGVMTEDMIVEQERIFEQMGTSEQAAKTRARMQCAQLISGMHN
jgi:hypothetical protein